MNKIIIFGTEVVAERILNLRNLLLKDDAEIVGFIDNNKNVVGKVFYNKIIQNPSELHLMEFDYIVIASDTHYKEMYTQLINLGIENNKIVICHEIHHYECLGSVTSREEIFKDNYLYNKSVDNYSLHNRYNALEETIIASVNVELIHIFENNISTHIFRTLYANLFEYISGHTDIYPHDFFKYVNIDSVQDQHFFLTEKAAQYEQFYKLYLNKDIYFSCNYNENNNSFTLKEKVDLLLFMYYHGIRHVNVKITRTEYEKYLNKSGIQNLMKVLSENSEYIMYAPVLNPYFADLYIARDFSFYTRIDKIFKKLRGYKLEGKSILDIGCSCGYNARMYSREGAIVSAIEIDEKVFLVAKAINELEYSNVKLMHSSFESISKENTYDIAILTTILYWYLDDENILNHFLENINMLINDMIIWESGSEPEREKELIKERTKFKNYTYVGTTIGTGKVREIGIFTK